MQIDTNIYCLATGKPIAAISDDEFGVILSAYAHIASDRREALIERLTLSSMRPSLAWMSVTPQSIDSLREAAPRELLAYLMNRMYAPLELTNNVGKPLHGDERLNACRLRIQIWQSIESATFTDEQLDQMLFILLMIDSRYNLAKIAKPTAIVQLWQSWTDIESFLKALWDWHGTLRAVEEEAQRRAKWQADFWSGGNRLTRLGYAKQFDKVTPPVDSARSVERRSKDARAAEKVARFKDDVDFLDQLEAELTTRSAQPPVQFPATPKKIFRFGVKKEA